MLLEWNKVSQKLLNIETRKKESDLIFLEKITSQYIKKFEWVLN